MPKFLNNQIVYVDLMNDGNLQFGCIVGITFVVYKGDYVYNVLTTFGHYEVPESYIHLTG